MLFHGLLESRFVSIVSFFLIAHAAIYRFNVQKWCTHRLYEDARRGGLGNSSLFPTGPPRFFFEIPNPYMYQNRTKKIPILTCIKIADNVLELLLGLAPTLLDLRPFVASQVHIDFTLAAK